MPAMAGETLNPHVTWGRHATDLVVCILLVCVCSIVCRIAGNVDAGNATNRCVATIPPPPFQGGGGQGGGG